MAGGDITIAVKQITKIDGVDITNNLLFTSADIPNQATIISVQCFPRKQTDGTIVYDVIAVGAQ